jgi:hypothetical protein
MRLLRKDSTFAEAALLRAKANYHLGRYSESQKEIDHVISIRPRQDAFARAYYDRAWFRLNCPDQSYRNGQQALKDATAACKLIGWKDEDMIDTLAAAYAEVGDFDSAVRYEEKALGIKGVKTSDSERLQAHLDSFKQRRPLPRSLDNFLPSAALFSVAPHYRISFWGASCQPVNCGPARILSGSAENSRSVLDCQPRRIWNIDLQVCAPSGVARFHASGKRTECPLGAQAAGLCSPAGTARTRFRLSVK